VYNLINLNLYHYSNNNPIKYIDPTGEEVLTITVGGATIGIGAYIAIGCVVILVYAAITYTAYQYQNGYWSYAGDQISDFTSSTWDNTIGRLIDSFTPDASATIIDSRPLSSTEIQTLNRKMAIEIEGIRAKQQTQKQGVQYSLRAIADGYYTDYTGGGTVFLKAGQVWKYGETTSEHRYSDSFLTANGLLFVPEFAGNQMEIKIAEKTKIYGYYIANGRLPPGNKIFR
jgi:hypothetical protein